MVVGVLRMQLRIDGNDSLKAKRSVVKSVLEKTQHRFNVAAAEVADNDVHTLASLAFAVVSSQRTHAASVLSNIMDYVNEVSAAPVFREQTEFVNLKATPQSDDDDDMLLRWSDFEGEP